MKHKSVRAAIACFVLAVTANAAADRWEDKARDILAKTVAMRTAMGHGQVPGMLEYIAGELRAGGFADADITVEPFGETATLIARFKSDRLGGERPILLLAHADVVDADPKDWELNPFELTERDGFFFGRGVQDNKFGIAMLTTVFLKLRADGFLPRRDLIMVLSGDEETQQKTTERLTSKDELRRAEFALNTDSGGGRLSPDGKPTAYFVQAAEKTYATFSVTVRNPGGHSSAPRADNAIYELAASLGGIADYRFPVQVNDTTIGFMSAMAEVMPGKTGAALAALAANPEDAAAADHLFDLPEFVGTTRTTCVATRLEAGHAENALPQRATATVNCRIFPDSDVEAVRRSLAAAAGEGAQVALVDKAYLASASPLREDVFAAVGEAMRELAPGVPVVPSMSSGYTDGSYFRRAGVPTYGVSGVFMRPEDSFAHGLNERVPVAALGPGLRHWQMILERLAGP